MTRRWPPRGDAVRILIVDDPALLQAIEACFELPESVDNLVSASRLEDALGVLRSQRVDVVLFDLRLLDQCDQPFLS